MRVDFIRSSYIRFYEAHREEILQAIDNRFMKGSLIMEEAVREFEKKFAKFAKKKYCIAVRSGTDALLMASKIREIDGTQEYRYRLPLEAYCGLPIRKFGMKDGAVDLEHLEKRAGKGECILITYMNSVQPDMKKLARIKRKKKLFIIEDACQAVGRPLIGDISCFSLYPAKMVGGMGKGGAIVTDNKKIYEKLKAIRDDKWNNLWLDEIKAAYLNIRLKYLPSLLKRRQKIVDYYNKHLPSKVRVLSKKCLQNYIILERNHKKLIEFLSRRGVEAFSDDNSFYEGNIKEGVRLPIYPEMTDKEVSYVVRVVNEFYA